MGLLRSSLKSVDHKTFSRSFSLSILKFSCIYFILFVCQTACTLKLDNDGAYHVVVAIDRKTAKNNIEGYVTNIQQGLQSLSDFLHSATERKFYIKSVDIVLPEHWNFPANELATANYFENSDIRISHEFQEPYAYNAKLCGSSGEYIQLPYDFFNVPDVGGHYGRVQGVLLKQWARYRYGVWEEHGYPLDSSFPYFFQTPGEPDWKVNYCSNIQFSGDVKTLDGAECDREDPDVNPPGYDCRFFPDEEQEATSSIMSFQFISSLNKFCDKFTHVRTTPNRQNVYCSYRSAQEVIKASSDWESVTTGNSAPQAIEFTVKKMAKKPLLYLVLDGGLTQAPGFVMNRIKDNLKILVNGSTELPEGVIANVGSFSAEAENNGKSLTEELPWSDIKIHKEDIEKAIDSSFAKKSGFRDFALAIKEAIDNIRDRQHEFGKVMIIVKTGEATNFDKIYYEDEVSASIKELGIKVYTFEVRANAMKPSLNLANLASETGGTHTPISGERDLDDMLSKMEIVAQDLRNFQFNPRKSRIIYKGVVEPNAEITLSATDISKLSFFLVSINHLIITNPRIEQVEDETGEASVSLGEKVDWWPQTGQIGSGATRITYKGEYTYTVPQSEPEVWKIGFGCSDECPSYLVISGELQSDSEMRSEEVQVFITTSALDGNVDLHEDLQMEAIQKFNTPFGIYAKLQHNGFPIKNVGDKISVQAVISLRDSSMYWTVDLVDNGAHKPDVTSNDGVFSGSFVPDLDGIFKISIQVTFLATREDGGDEPTTTAETTDIEYSGIRSKNDGRRLVSVDQRLIGCGSDFSGCWATIVPFDFMKVVDYIQTITFVNKEYYTPVPQKILDLRAIHLDDYKIELEWTHPGVVDESGTGSISRYELVYSENFEEIVDDFDAGTPKPVDCSSPPIPGTKCNLVIENGGEVTYFYALRSVLSENGVDIKSPAHNVVGITSLGKAPVTIPPALPPTTTTTTSTTTTTTTTEPPPTTTTVLTTTGGPTTTSTRRPSTTSTTTGTTEKRTTTTLRPTSAIPTSTEAPVKHWYLKPGGYLTISAFVAGIILIIICSCCYLKLRSKALLRAREELLIQGATFA